MAGRGRPKKGVAEISKDVVKNQVPDVGNKVIKDDIIEDKVEQVTDSHGEDTTKNGVAKSGNIDSHGEGRK